MHSLDSSANISDASEGASLVLKGLCKDFGGLTVTDQVNLAITAHNFHALIGPNGAGKTTLMAQILGELAPDAGQIYLDQHDITRWRTPQRALAGMARSYQITQLLASFSVLENVMLMQLARCKPWQQLWRPVLSNARLRERAMQVLDQVGLADVAYRATTELAHGEQRQLELAMVLVTQPRLLLLDEPLAGMSQSESARMTELLLELKGHYTILMVEHDMEAVFRLADQVSVLVYGKVLASGAPEQIRNNPEVLDAYLGNEA